MLFVFNWMLYIGSFVHPFFISMTDINHNAKDKTLEVSVRIFTDDFENTLRKSCNCKVSLVNAPDKLLTNSLVSAYILKHVQLKVDGRPVSLQFAGYQQEEGSTWSYFEVKNIAQVHTVDISSDILYELNEAQVNMLHIKANNKEQTDKMEFPKKNYSATF